MLSRVAANLYWLSRYIERSDGILRMLKINYASSQDSLQQFSWAPVIKIYSGLDEDTIRSMEFNSREVLLFMFSGKENPNSISNIITLARENARSVQDHIPKDLWQCLNEYYHLVKDKRLIYSLRRDDPTSVLDELIKQVMLYYGIAEVTMERGEGRSFMNIGKYLERSIQSADILDTKLDVTNNDPDLLSGTSYLKYLLLSLGAYDLYLKTYRQGFDAENILELVVLNNDFPRSVLYSVNNIHRYFERLKSNKNIIEFKELSFLIGRLQSMIQYSTVDSIMQQGLHSYLALIKKELYRVGNTLNVHYFAYS
ncbi:putative alpha-E superfamily protein [Arcticibacter tournemirensis]|uniref:Alpha-E domain-containing protein n=1 Tax=Arcticibacter tournemirensis TaxID=699437 RepID=A0A4Q0MEH7_9SPHI|nr:alpha-E domain-containing protein [Arcticibacter tournemirensis]KAA8482271.1 alpha-E domain-containing protein [Arcticibacter tournemirensis]RXF71379.1 alpha-E domain-containing protein [Arcticibacter tournemirensis]TQM52411.1 putative alpha-E superfamily protein [Arcticibacter tournemirensis]